MVRIDRVRDLAVCIRERRRELGMTQTDLAGAAGVSRRWLSSLEAGKLTAEIGLVLRTLDALDLVLDTHPGDDRPGRGDQVDIDAHLGLLRRDLSDTVAVFRTVIGDPRPVRGSDDR